MRMTARVAGALAAVAIGAASPAAAENGTATGAFETREWKVPLHGAYAFVDKASLGEGQAILVAVSNSGFATDFIDGLYYRRHAIDTKFADDETRVVYFEFDLRGRYQGYSYFFGSGDGCGYCGGGAVKSTVALADSRLKGTLTLKDKKEKVSFDVALDVPVAADDWGTALPAGGGEAGKAYQAYHAALTAGDGAKVKKLCSAGRIEVWQKAEKDGHDADYLAYLGEERPDTVTIGKGFVRGDHAVLLVSGEDTVVGAMYGEAHLYRENGAWKVDDEDFQLGTP